MPSLTIPELHDMLEAFAIDAGHQAEIYYESTSAEPNDREQRITCELEARAAALWAARDAIAALYHHQNGRLDAAAYAAERAAEQANTARRQYLGALW